MTPNKLAKLIELMVEQTGAVCIERLHCDRCEHTSTYIHPFLERVLCGKCEASLRSHIPRRPDPGEPTAADYEEALNEFAKNDLETAIFLRDLATTIASS